MKESMKNPMNAVKNQLGMTLIEVTMVLGLLGIAGLGVASLMGNVFKTSKTAEIVTAKNQFASALGTYLYSSTGCRTLENITFADTAHHEMAVTGWQYQSHNIIQKDTDMSLFVIKSLTAQMNDTAALPIIKITNPATGTTKDLKKTHVNITLLMMVKEKISNLEKSHQRHVFKIPVMVDPSNNNNIELCGNNFSASDTCSALKGKLNPATKLCELNETCMTHGSYVTLTCNPQFNGIPCDTTKGAPLVNPVTGTLGCPIGTVASATGAETWNVQRSCGKKCTADINHTLGYFTCLKCP
jgi:type II secretory pathway pseudopilin PulG